MTILREGGSQLLALTVEARPSSANANYLAVATAESQGYAVPLEGVLRANLALAALNAALFAAVATQLFESRLAPLFVLVALATNPFFLAAAVCQLPAQLATIYFVIGAACFACVDGCSGRALKRLAVTTLALCTVLAMLTRNR